MRGQISFTSNIYILIYEYLDYNDSIIYLATYTAKGELISKLKVNNKMKNGNFQVDSNFNIIIQKREDTSSHPSSKVIATQYYSILPNGEIQKQ